MIDSSKCIGCQACVDVCPAKALDFVYNTWGEGKSIFNSLKCIKCGLCEKICPSLNSLFNNKVNNVFAVISKVNKMKGSSGGLFYELAKVFILNGGIVYGAAFDENLKLIHKKASTLDEIIPLCKSKYIHSDMTGVYSEIITLLKNGKKVMFVGTPCQTSSLKNLCGSRYKDTLFLVDFLCRGTGTQKIFDACVLDEELRKKGKITRFEFRSKTRNAEHSFSYVIKSRKKEKKVSGYSFEFSYYNAYLKYIIFNDYCYTCKYAQNYRVGDITLGDFWGIQKFNKELKDINGVSMVALNNEKGEQLFNEVRQFCKIYQYPLEYATSKNESFNKPVDKIKEKEYLVKVLEQYGIVALIDELKCKNVKKNLIYAKTPRFIKKIYNKLVK